MGRPPCRGGVRTKKLPENYAWVREGINSNWLTEGVSQVACGNMNNNTSVRVKRVGQGQEVGQRLARAGGREEHEVAPGLPGAVGGALHGGEGGEAEAGEGLLYVHIYNKV